MPRRQPAIDSSLIASLDPEQLFECLLLARDRDDGDVASECAQVFAFRIKPQLTRWARKRLPEEAVGEVVDEAIERVVGSSMKASTRFRGETLPELFAWVYRILRNTTADHFRRIGKPAEHGLTIESLDGAPGEDGDSARSITDEEDGYARVEIEMVTEQVLAGLSPDHREVVQLAVHQDLASAEVADRTGKTVANVDQIKSRYRRDLRSALEATGTAATGSGAVPPAQATGPTAGHD